MQVTIAVSEKGKTMGDSIIFMSGVWLGVFVTCMFVVVALATDWVRREKDE